MLYLVKRKEALLAPLAEALAVAAAEVKVCTSCGNIDTIDPCSICQDQSRDITTLIVVADVADLWALERTEAHRARYHVLGGVLSALDGVGPSDLSIAALVERCRNEPIEEVILAIGATIEGQTTAHYIIDQLDQLVRPSPPLRVSRLAHGVPVGGELEYLDEGTVSAALRARTPVSGGPR
jgi:recombination protein RecR